MNGALERSGTITVGIPAPASVGREERERTELAVFPSVVVAELRVVEDAEVVEEASSEVVAAAVVEAADLLVALLSSDVVVSLAVVAAAVLVASAVVSAALVVVGSLFPVVAAAVVVVSSWAEARVTNARSRRNAWRKARIVGDWPWGGRRW